MILYHHMRSVLIGTGIIFFCPQTGLAGQELAPVNSSIYLSSQDLAQVGKTLSFPGLNEPMLLKEINGRNRPVRNKETGIAVIEHPVAPGENVWNILEKGNIQPNADLIGVVRSLNPEIARLSDIQPGQNIFLPAVSHSGAIPETDRYIIVDTTFRNGFDEALLEAGNLEKNSSPDEEVSSVVNSIRQLSEIRDDLPADFIGSANQDIAQYSKILEDIELIRSGREPVYFRGTSLKTLSKAKSETAQNIKHMAYDAYNSNKVSWKLSVKTIYHDYTSEICNLFIYYTTIARTELYQNDLKSLISKSARFQNPSSPSIGIINMRSLAIWAMWNGEVVSDFNPVTVSRIDTSKDYVITVQDGEQCE